VIIPRNNKTATTIDLSVTTEIVVIIDDATAVEVRRSEYHPELKPPTPTSPVVCPSPEPPAKKTSTTKAITNNRSTKTQLTASSSAPTTTEGRVVTATSGPTQP
jgi:hypothetical protein